MCCFDSDKLGFCFLYYSPGATVGNFSVAGCKGYILFSYIRKAIFFPSTILVMEEIYLFLEISLQQISHIYLCSFLLFSLLKVVEIPLWKRSLPPQLWGPQWAHQTANTPPQAGPLVVSTQFSDSSRVFLKCVTWLWSEQRLLFI